MATTVLSAQEEAIQSGRKTLHEGLSDRIQRMHEAVRSKRDPIIGLSRALLFTESFKETEGSAQVGYGAEAPRGSPRRARRLVGAEELR